MNNTSRNPMLLAVISAILCLPFGLVAVFYARKSMEFRKKDLPENARRNSIHADRWAISAIIAGLLFWTLTILRLKTM